MLFYYIHLLNDKKYVFAIWINWKESQLDVIIIKYGNVQKVLGI